VTTGDDLLVAAGHSVDPGRWLGIFDELMTRVGGRFGRAEPRKRSRAFVLGLLAEQQDIPYVLAVACHHRVPPAPGAPCAPMSAAAATP
jgi:hypothetical protein